MKKCCLFLLALLMMVGLCACGDSAAIQTPDNSCSNGHRWDKATCEVPQTCSVCGAAVGEPKHRWQGADCEAPAACTLCGVSAGEAPGHAYTDWGVNQQYALVRYCWLCGREDVYSLAEMEQSTNTMGQLPLLTEFRSGAWTAKLIMGETLNQCKIPEASYEIVFSADVEKFLWPEVSFVDLSSEIGCSYTGLQVSGVVPYSEILTDASGVLICNDDGSVCYELKLMNGAYFEKYKIMRMADEDVLYELFIYYTPEFPNGLMEVVMHKEQQRVFFTKDDPENHGENPFCRVVTD